MTAVAQTFEDKNEAYWRISIGNINSFPVEDNGSSNYKLDMLKKLVVSNHSDLILISEHNRNIQNVQSAKQPNNLIKHWWPQTITRTSYLVSKSKSTYEPGGTMIITHSKATRHTCRSGEDKYLLGRWNYITLKGKNGHYTTIISIYRPSKQQETYLRQTAFSASRRDTVPDISPDELWYADLRELIKEELQKGHEIIVAGDFNDDLNNTFGVTVVFM